MPGKGANDVQVECGNIIRDCYSIIKRIKAKAAGEDPIEMGFGERVPYQRAGAPE